MPYPSDVLCGLCGTLLSLEAALLITSFSLSVTVEISAVAAASVAVTSVITATSVVSAVVLSLNLFSLSSSLSSIALENFALVYPNLYAELTVCCISLSETVVDISTDSLERDSTLVVALASCDLGNGKSA